MNAQFVDLSKLLNSNNTTVAICGIGGIPIKEQSSELTWAGSSITVDKLKNHICEAVGLSGMTTYRNKSNLSFEKLGKICLDKKHTWAFRWITLSFVVSGYSKSY